METIVRFFQEGGTFMYPIAIIMAIGLAIAFERLFFLMKEKSSNRQAFDDMLPMLQKRDLRAALNYANSSDSKIGNILKSKNVTRHNSILNNSVNTKKLL